MPFYDNCFVHQSTNGKTGWNCLHSPSVLENVMLMDVTMESRINLISSQHKQETNIAAP